MREGCPLPSAAEGWGAERPAKPAPPSSPSGSSSRPRAEHGFGILRDLEEEPCRPGARLCQVCGNVSSYKGWAAADELLPAVRFVGRTCGRLSVAPSATQNLRLLRTKKIAQGQWDRMEELRSAGNAARRARDLQEGRKQEWRWPPRGAMWEKPLQPRQLDSTKFPTVRKNHST